MPMYNQGRQKKSIYIARGGILEPCVLIVVNGMAQDKRKHPQADKKSWGENKNQVTIMLTPTATKALDTRAEMLGISRSELLERIARQLTPTNDMALSNEELQILGEALEPPLNRSA